MRSLSSIVKGRKTIDAVELYQFFSDFAIEESKEEEAEEIQEPEPSAIEDAEAAKQRAEEILEEARQEAQKILEDAKAQCDKMWKGALEEGRKAGYEEGQKESALEREQALSEFRQEMSELIGSVEREKTVILEKYQDDLKNIALAVAEKVIHTSLKSSETVIHRMIIAATDKLKKTEWAKIYISKAETELAMSADTEFLNALSHLSDHVKIVSMDNEEEGVCIIELPDEIIDASVSTQLENIKDIMNNART